MDERIGRQYLSSEFGHLSLGKIEIHLISSWFAKLVACGLAPATCNRILAALKAVFSFAARSGYLSSRSSPCLGISSLPVRNQRQRALSGEEAKSLMLELRQHACQEALAVRLLLLTGARKREILNARWENIDFARNILIVPVSKSGRPRQIVFSDEAMTIIKRMAICARGPWLFAGPHSGKPLSDIYVFWNRIRQKLGISDVRIHDLRHTFASFLVNAGHTLYEAQNLLGHMDPRTTMRYAHLSEEAMRGAAATVSLMLDNSGAMPVKKGATECPLLSAISSYVGEISKMGNIKRLNLDVPGRR